MESNPTVCYQELHRTKSETRMGRKQLKKQKISPNLNDIKNLRLNGKDPYLDT